MFNLKPENMTGDTNKLLFAILTELKKLNETQSLRPIAKDVVVEPKVVKSKTPKKDKPKKDKSKKEVVKNVNTRQTRKLSKVQQ
jgi:hypothetical protein